jgi:hypothetical protein
MGKVIQIGEIPQSPIDHFYRVNEATLNFNPTEWLDLYNHTDPKAIPAQKGTERPDRPALRATEIAITLTAPRVIEPRQTKTRSREGTQAHQSIKNRMADNPIAPPHRRARHQPRFPPRPQIYAFATYSTMRIQWPSKHPARESLALATTAQNFAMGN